MRSRDRWAVELWYMCVSMGSQPIVISVLIVLMIAAIVTRGHR